MKILVCGGRDFRNAALVDHVLYAVQKRKGVTLIIEGGATGADTLARQWAWKNNIPFKTCPADWTAHGKAAGAIRNRQMLEQWKPDGVIAFRGGKGTADMVRRAKAAGVKVWEIA